MIEVSVSAASSGGKRDSTDQDGEDSSSSTSTSFAESDLTVDELENEQLNAVTAALGSTGEREELDKTVLLRGTNNRVRRATNIIYSSTRLS